MIKNQNNVWFMFEFTGGNDLLEVGENKKPV